MQQILIAKKKSWQRQSWFHNETEVKTERNKIFIHDFEKKKKKKLRGVESNLLISRIFMTFLLVEIITSEWYLNQDDKFFMT